MTLQLLAMDSSIASAAPPPCPLCGRGDAPSFHEDGPRIYYRCGECALIYLHPAHRPSPEQERARYLEHINIPNDPAYQDFLRRMGDPVMERLAPGARGLDFGCGTAPVLSNLFTDAGFPCEAYDPFFRPAEHLLDRQYDFVVCSEVVEHVFEPAVVFGQLFGLLEEGGILGVMTRFYGHEAPFERWWYRRDPTHVCFYSETVMEWIAARYGRVVRFPRPHVAVFTDSRGLPVR